MNRHVKLSIVLVAVLLAIACMFTACSGKLEEKVDDNATKAEAAVKDAADKAAADLATAKTALEKAIAAGDAAAIASAAADLENALDAAEKAAADADAALAAAIADAKKVADDATAAITKVKNDLATNIKKVTVELEAARADLAALIAAGDAADQAALTAAKTEIEGKILAANDEIAKNAKLIADLDTALATAKTDLGKDITDLETALNGTITSEVADLYTAIGNLKTELNGLITGLRTDINAATETHKTFVTNWNATTDAIIDAWDDIIAIYNTVNPNLYADAQMYALYTAYDVAYIKLFRALTTTELEAAVEEFETFVDELPSVLDIIEAKLDEAALTVDELTLDDAATVADARKLINDVLNSGNTDAIEALDDSDLIERCTAYEVKLAELAAKADGAKIKAQMDKALENLITADTDLKGIRNLYDAWIAIDGNDLEDVEGFQATYDAFVAAEARIVALGTARDEAADINTQITAIFNALVADGATLNNQKTLGDVTKLVEDWDTTYFSGDYAVEKGSKEVEASVNYKMLNHDLYNKAVAKYDELVKNFKAAADKFLAALEAIGEVDLLKGDEIEAAWDAYYAWVLESKISSFDYVLDVAGGHGPDYFYNTLVDKATEFKNLAADALAAYEALTFDGNVDIYSEPEIDAVLKWYADYAVVVDGEYAFDYVLSDTITVTAEDYADILAAEKLCDELMAAKDAETQTVEDLITAIGTVTYADKAAIDAAEAAYTEWAKDIVSTNDRYVVENAGDLFAAKITWAMLKTEADLIHEAIADLAEMNVADDRDAYKDAIEAIDTAIATFKTHNGGDLEGVITDAENATIAAAKLALAKYDALADLAELYAAKKLLANTDASLDNLDTSYTAQVKAITEATAIEDVTNLMGLAEEQFDAILAKYNSGLI